MWLKTGQWWYTCIELKKKFEPRNSLKKELSPENQWKEIELWLSEEKLGSGSLHVGTIGEEQGCGNTFQEKYTSILQGMLFFIHTL